MSDDDSTAMGCPNAFSDEACQLSESDLKKLLDAAKKRPRKFDFRGQKIQERRRMNIE